MSYPPLKSMKILPKKHSFGWKFFLWDFLAVNTLSVCGQLAAVLNTLASGEDSGLFENQFVLSVRKRNNLHLMSR